MRQFLINLTLTLFIGAKAWALPSIHRSYPETWYERAARHINPTDINYGAAWEAYKQQLIAKLYDPNFRYGAASSLAVAILLLTNVAQHLSHRRAMRMAIQAMVDLQRHDQYARDAARDAIAKYNTHIEQCNRVIEGDESGLWKWMSSSGLAAMKNEAHSLKDELNSAQEEIRRLTAELDAKSKTLAEMSVRTKSSVKQVDDPSSVPIPAAHIQRINQLELELNLEKKKNQRLKGTALDARNS